MTYPPQDAAAVDLDAAATAWITEDPDPDTRRELTDLLTAYRAGDAAAAAALTDAFSGTLQFGTAGLRGRLGGGPNRMNRVVVIRAAAGLSAYLHEMLGDGFRVVIGYDARHGSARFARDTAAVVTGAGGRAILFDTHCPTPVLAFALRRLGADAGVMVTASHNPPQDNGYKVYLGGRAVTGSGQGAQIVPPHDSAIAAKIAAVGPLASVPMPEDGWETIGADMVEEYVQRAVKAARTRAVAPLKIVLTAMHGVGGEICREVLARTGFDDVVVVPEQFAPDPEFPTVAFPNPEEPGALDLAFARAREVGADLIIANDPDADRCSAAVPDEHARGGWRQLTGDEVGSLLGEQAAELAAFTGTGVLANSIVSSRLLRKIAQAHGLAHRNTLTGFKWISREPNLVFGYEEALGYCVDPAAVRDKDGISASVRLAVLASTLKQQGRTLDDLLDRLAREHGLYATSPLSVRVEDKSFITNAMERLRSGGAPATLAGSPVVDVFDLMDGANNGNGERLPATDGLIFKTAANDRVVVRPSGTEPKLKCYCEVVMPVAVDEPVEVARRAAAKRLDAIKADLRGVLGI
ncbi:phosphomannomutase [Actinomyces sp. 432]|uniref:phospho-sugar mutase n=1 Tax=unclassified Actinomyces TaxID=2609248 RepID=UPI0013741351|nr:MULTISPECIES: phospho-sugar mutase [unclassified Actinomyces]MBW3070039.1 phospho-sugar mutase [Actinomyces sp. 594]QHO90561.1 phosphomannomutase [Actinomyces sp. 432]